MASATDPPPPLTLTGSSHPTTAIALAAMPSTTTSLAAATGKPLPSGTPSLDITTFILASVLGGILLLAMLGILIYAASPKAFLWLERRERAKLAAAADAAALEMQVTSERTTTSVGRSTLASPVSTSSGNPTAGRTTLARKKSRRSSRQARKASTPSLGDASAKGGVLPSIHAGTDLESSLDFGGPVLESPTSIRAPSIGGAGSPPPSATPASLRPVSSRRPSGGSVVQLFALPSPAIAEPFVDATTLSSNGTTSTTSEPAPAIPSPQRRLSQDDYIYVSSAGIMTDGNIYRVPSHSSIPGDPIGSKRWSELPPQPPPPPTTPTTEKRMSVGEAFMQAGAYIQGLRKSNSFVGDAGGLVPSTRPPSAGASLGANLPRVVSAPNVQKPPLAPAKSPAPPISPKYVAAIRRGAGAGGSSGGGSAYGALERGRWPRGAAAAAAAPRPPAVSIPPALGAASLPRSRSVDAGAPIANVRRGAGRHSMFVDAADDDEDDGAVFVVNPSAPPAVDRSASAFDLYTRPVSSGSRDSPETATTPAFGYPLPPPPPPPPPHAFFGYDPAIAAMAVAMQRSAAAARAAATPTVAQPTPGAFWSPEGTPRASTGSEDEVFADADEGRATMERAVFTLNDEDDEEDDEDDDDWFADGDERSGTVGRVFRPIETVGRRGEVAAAAEAAAAPSPVFFAAPPPPPLHPYAVLAAAAGGPPRTPPLTPVTSPGHPYGIYGVAPPPPPHPYAFPVFAAPPPPPPQGFNDEASGASSMYLPPIAEEAGTVDRVATKKKPPATAVATAAEAPGSVLAGVLGLGTPESSAASTLRVSDEARKLVASIEEEVRSSFGAERPGVGASPAREVVGQEVLEEKGEFYDSVERGGKVFADAATGGRGMGRGRVEEALVEVQGEGRKKGKGWFGGR
ncbi:hypothetical protein HDU96_008167 [Phlyctochytrium bullatum]|nr:hypothetical protein HDU96_008167 [Phlyctochytrium bullatum]